MFACHLRRGRIRKLATFRRFAWTRKIVKKGTPKDTFVLLGRRSKRAKDKQMNKKSLFGQKWDLRRVHYDFRNPSRTPKIHQIFGFFGYIFLQILAVLRKMDIIRFSAFSGIYTFNFKTISTKFVSAKILRIFLFFRKMFWKGGSFLKITLIFGLNSFIFCIRLTVWVFNYIIFE